MSVSAPAATVPFLLDGSLYGVVQVVNPAGLAVGATVVLRSTTQPDKVAKIASIAGLKVSVIGLAADAQAADVTNFRVNDAAVIYMPAQTVEALQAAPAENVASESIVGDLSVGGNAAVTGNSALTGTLGVTGIATLTGGASLPNGANIAAGTGSGMKVGTSAAQKLGLWNATPVIQPATTGTATGFVAGAGTPVLDDSTFSAGLGTKSYNISDIVLALKQAGILASS